MKRFFHGLTVCLALILSVLFTVCGTLTRLTPSVLKTDSPASGLSLRGFPLSLHYEQTALSAQAEADAERLLNARLMLMDTFPVKDVSVQLESRRYVIPGGAPFGIRLYTSGLVISSTSPVKTGTTEAYPARQAGIDSGDVILSVNGKALTTSEQLLLAVEESGGKPLSMGLLRNGQQTAATITPVYDTTQNHYRTGLYVRDSCAGIGTMTFIDPKTKSFAGLGHGICDSKSGCLMPMLRGDIVKTEITSVRKSTCGSPGTLVGHFSGDDSLGSLLLNSEYGVYGKLNTLPTNTETVPVAFQQEVVKGKATLLTSVDGKPPQPYELEIEDVSYHHRESARNMVIHVTDERLLSQTGGIVQGMSGSPILQNGRLVGAVTHVFVNDSTRGYAVFAENMMEANENLSQTISQQAG